MRHLKVRTGLASLAAAVALILALPSEASAQASNTGTGLWGEYFDTFDFSGARPARLDAQVNVTQFGTPGGAAATDLPAGMANVPAGSSQYIVRWQGMIEGPTGSTGSINLSLNVDDGGRLYVDGVLMIDFWRQGGIGTPPGGAQQQATVTIAVGQKKHIRIEMYEEGGNDGAILSWTHAAQASVVPVPTVNLYPEMPTPRILLSGPNPTTDAQIVRIVDDCIGHSGTANDVVEIRYSTNGNDINTVADGIAYTGPFVVTANATVKARAFRPSFPTPQSAQAQTILQVNDTTVPRLTRIQSVDDQSLLLTFSEPPATAAANTAANYTLDAGGAVTAAAVQPNLVSVLLTTTGLVSATDYFLTFPNGMADQAPAPNSIPANATVALTHRPPSKTNLVDWYDFNEGTGTTAADTSGNGTGGGNGTLAPASVDSPLWDEGVIGSSLFFNGYNNEVTVGALEGILGGTCSISVWVKTQARGFVGGTDSTDVHGIVGVSEAATPVAPAVAQDIKYLYLDGTGQLVSRTGNGAVIDSNFTMNNSAWHHVLMTRDSGSGNIQIFVDGVSRVNSASEAGVKTTTFNAIGRLLGTATSTQRWLGYLDEVRFYNSVLTATDVYDLYNAPPTVTAGPDQVITSGFVANLNASNITDDGFPAPAAISWSWSMVSSPPGGSVTFGASSGVGSGNAANTTATFTTGGTYVLRLIASDGRLRSSDDITIDLPKIAVNVISTTTTEAGGTATFTVRLTAQPANDVNLTLSSDDTGEGTPDFTTLVFTTTTGQAITTDVPTQTMTGGWDVLHTVTITGVDDDFKDGNITYHINFGATTSVDGNFAGITPAQITLSNTDNDTPGIFISPIAGLNTSEAGGVAGSDTFIVRLLAQPQPGVTVQISITSLTPGEASSNVTRLDFLPNTGTLYSIAGGIGTGSWDEDHIVTITGVQDTVLDFAQVFTIQTGAAAVTGGTDNDYNGMAVSDVQGTNADDEQIPELKKVWGCGLAGAEILLPLGLLALLRRRRRDV